MARVAIPRFLAIEGCGVLKIPEISQTYRMPFYAVKLPYHSLEPGGLNLLPEKIRLEEEPQSPVQNLFSTRTTTLCILADRIDIFIVKSVKGLFRKVQVIILAKRVLMC